jgi:hypothetical protein
MSTPVCHYCSRPIDTGTPIVLWDGKSYCSACIEAVDPALIEYARTHTDLSETMTAEKLRAWRVLTNPQGIGFCLGFLLPLFVAFWVIIAFTQGDERMCAGCCCLGTNFLVWALILFSSGTDYHAALGRLPRTVRLVGGELVVETPSHQWSIPLAECDWFPSYTDANRETCFLLRSPAIIVVHLNKEYLPIGLTPEMYRVWYAFFTLSRLPNRGRFPWIRLLAGWTIGIPSGLGLGVGLGQCLKEMTGDDVLPLAYGVLGTFDGFFIPFSLVWAQWIGESWTKETGNKWKSGARLAFGFGMLGLFVTGGRGVGVRFFPSGLILVLLNTCIGFFVGWWCGRLTYPPARGEGGQNSS